MRTVIGMAIATVAAMAASGAAAQSYIDEWLFTGTIGTDMVTAVFDVRGGRTLLGGHYFYDRYRKDIPLTGSVDGEKVSMREPGGGIFALRFKPDDKAALQTPTFDNSMLVGSWSDRGRSLPVTLSLSSGGPMIAGEGRYAHVTDAPAPVFEKLVARFIHGVTTNDHAEAAAATSFPLNVYATEHYTVRSRTELFAHWSQIFTPCVVAALKQAVPHDMFVHNGEAMVSDGIVWFGDAGATSIAVAHCIRMRANRQMIMRHGTE